MGSSWSLWLLHPFFMFLSHFQGTRKSIATDNYSNENRLRSISGLGSGKMLHFSWCYFGIITILDDPLFNAYTQKLLLCVVESRSFKWLNPAPPYWRDRRFSSPARNCMRIIERAGSRLGRLVFKGSTQDGLGKTCLYALFLVCLRDCVRQYRHCRIASRHSAPGLVENQVRLTQ